MTRDSTVPLLSHLRRLAVLEHVAAPSDSDCLSRFVSRGDETAFAVLVRRHGPMVFRVCRAVLREETAAEDAFQATFLVLARRAGSVRTHQSLASWLYKVAHRIAVQARMRELERRRHEALALRRPGANASGDVAWRDVQAVVFAEIARLPERYREALLLCCWEGRTRDEAAAQLGCRVGTLKSRLERGRRLLRARLVRRGLTLSAALLAAEAARAGEPPVRSLTVRAATAAATAVRTGRPVTDFVSNRAAELAGSAVRHLTPTVAIALCAVGALVVATAGWFIGNRVAGSSAYPSGAPAVAAAGNANATPPPAVARFDADGDPLPPDAVSRLGTLRLRDGNGATVVRFMPDGKTLLSQGSDGARLWDVATGKLLRTYTRSIGGSCLVLPDGRRFVSATEGGVRLFDVGSPDPVRTLAKSSHAVLQCSPDGDRIAILSVMSGNMEVLELATGRTLWSKRPAKESLRCIAFSADGKTLIAAGSGMQTIPPAEHYPLLVLDSATGAERLRLDVGPRNIERLTVSPDGRYLLAVYFDGKEFGRGVMVRELRTGRELYTVDPPKNTHVPGQDYFSSVAIAPGGKTFLGIGGFGSVIEWDLSTGREQRRFGQGMVCPFGDLAVTADGKTVAVACPSELRLYDFATGRQLTRGVGNSAQINQVAISRDGTTVATASPTPTLYFWDVRSGRLQGTVASPDEPGWQYRLADDTRTAFAFRWDGNATRVLDLPSGRLRRELPGRLLAVAADERLVATEADTIQFVDALTGRTRGSIPKPAFKWYSTAFADDGRLFFILGPDHTVAVWDVAAAKKLRQFGPLGDWHYADPIPCDLRDERAPYWSAVSPDGLLIAYCNVHGYLALLDAVDGRQIWRVDHLPRGFDLLAFSPDGRMIACRDGHEATLRIYEAATGKERRTFSGHRGTPYCVVFSPDCKTLVSGARDTTAMVWDLTGNATGKRAGLGQTPDELERCWTDLAGADAAAAFVAIQRLSAAPDRTVPYLAQRLRPVPAVDAKTLQGWIADLDSDDFSTRERAASELARCGDAALGACRQRLASTTSAHVRRQLAEIVAKLVQRAQVPGPEPLAALRTVEVLERCGTPEARKVLQTIATGVPEARLTQEAKAALVRLTQNDGTPP